MSNDFYNVGTTFIPHTRVKSEEVNAELTGVAAGFAKLPGELDLNYHTHTYDATDAGTANNYVIALPQTALTYRDGMEIRFKAANTNTGASVINVDALGNKTLARIDGTAVVAGDIEAGAVVLAIYESTSGKFLIVSQNPNYMASADEAAASAAAAAASAAEAEAAAATVTGTISITQTFDDGTKTVTRVTQGQKISRETAAAVIYTMGDDATEDWQLGDFLHVQVEDSCDVTVNRAGTGVFELPDGTTATSIQATKRGMIALWKHEVDTDNWKLEQQ